MKFPTHFKHLHTRDRGFALIVTLSLMILLTIIAVGLLTLSSISLRQSGASSANRIAQNNARMALFLALGELQRHAGVDQRVTATADVAGTDTGDPLPATGVPPANNLSVNGLEKGLSAVQQGTRYWTGIWKNRSATPTTEIFTKTPSPEIQQWLISGNEALPGSNRITPSAADYTVKPDGSVGDTTRAVVLVGEGSVGNSGAGDLDRYVVAPLVSIGKNTNKPEGRYAWWVGDEGVKARINMERSLNDPKNYVSLPAQRRGWESVEGLAGYPKPDSAAHASLPKVTSLQQAELLLTGAEQALQKSFHSATADSKAVIADTVAGGTRVDLTPILAGDLPATKPANAADIANYPIRGGRVIPVTGGSAPREAPIWDTVNDFHDAYSQLNNGELLVKAAANTRVPSIAPVITDFRVLMGARILPPSGTNGAAATEFRVHPCGKIAVAIANPYSVPLTWNRDLEFEIKSQTPAGNNPSRIWPLGGGSGPAFLPANPSESAVFNGTIFRIRAGKLEPGEGRAFTQSAAILRPNGSGGSRVVIDLVPFSTASPFSFANCIELENQTARTPPLTMDVRESWQTTLMMLEMRLSGSASSVQPLARVERFELDNGYFSPNQRTFTLEDCRKTNLPVPLMLYSFQISQPGGDYKSYMPSNYQLGQRGSTLRTFADFNLAATRVSKPISSYNPPPYFMESNDSRAQLPSNAPGGATGTAFTRNLVSNPLPWGRGPTGSQKTILFSLPPQLTSLAQLQHADLTGDDFAGSLGHQPGNAFGNSYATPFVRRSLTVQSRVDYEIIGAPNRSGTNNTTRRYFDVSYLLNAAFWDSFFLSTIPKTGNPVPAIPAMVRHQGDDTSADLRDPVLAGGRLMIDGAFNVNSTDKNAWKAFLASAKHFRHQADTSQSEDAAFPRSLEQSSPSANPPSGTAADSFAGFRRLSDAELDALATEITRQVRLRGPFLSLSHFANRALAPITTHRALTRSGALQAAADESGININSAGDKKSFTGFTTVADAVTLRGAGSDGTPLADMLGGKTDNRPASASPEYSDWAPNSTDQNYGAVASITADREVIKDGAYLSEQGYRSTGIPGWLTQADILQVIGPSLTARTDTFRIRSYGEALDGNGNVIAKAYCEAIVQRIPTYIDPLNPPSARGVSLNTLNRTYGRQFQIVSFRWLSPLEV